MITLRMRTHQQCCEQFYVALSKKRMLEITECDNNRTENELRKYLPVNHYCVFGRSQSYNVRVAKDEFGDGFDPLDWRTIR